MPRLLAIVLGCGILAAPIAATAAATFEDAQSLLANNSYRAATDAFDEVAREPAAASALRASALRGQFWSRTGRDDLRALDALVEAVIADPTYRGNDWLLRRIGALAGGHGAPPNWAQQLERLETALAGVPAWMPHLAQLQAAYADQRGDWDAMAEHLADRAMICDFLVCGPFDNVAGSGMSTPQPPEGGIDPEAEYAGLGGMPVRWTSPRCGPYVVVDLDEFTDGKLNALMYALTHLRVDEDTEAVLHVAGGGAFRLWLNGELQLSENDTRYSLYQMYELPVRLRRGWNRLLVKVGAEQQALALSLRVSDRQGHVLRLQTQARPPVDLVAQVSSPHDPATGLETFPAGSWKREWASWPLGTSLADRLNLVAALMDLSFVDEVETLLDELENLFPQSELVGRQRVAALRLRESATADGVLRAWAAKAPESFLARFAVLRELRSQGEEDRVRDAVEAMYADFPHHPLVAMMYGWNLINLGETVRGLDLVESIYEQNRRDVGIQQIYYSLLQSLNRQADYRRAVVEDVALRPDLPNLAQQLASIELQSHDVDAAIVHLEQALKANGSPKAIYDLMASAFETENRIEEAVQACESGLQWSPYSASLHERLAKLLLATERREEAVAHLQTALAIDPANGSARELLRTLEGKKELSALFERDDPQDLQGSDLSWLEAPAQACYLIDQVELTVFPGGAQHYRRHYAILVRDESGVANYRTLEEGGGSIEIARILKPDGQEVDAEIGWGEITFPDLTPGDVIEVRVQSDSAPQPGLADHFWHGNAFQYEIPCALSRFSLLVPKSCTFEQRVHNGELEHVQREMDEWTLHQWEARQVPALPVETASPPALDQVLWLDLSTLTSWDMLVTWFLNESEGRLRATAPVRELAATITATAATDSAKIHALSTYVRANVEYEGGQFVDSPTVPRAAEEVLRTKFGDCKDQSGLIIAALRELGITAHFALVNSREVTTLEYLPSPRFTHAIVYARTGNGRVFWIDPTDEQLGFPNVPSILEGMTALLIDPTLDSPFVQIPLDDPSLNGMHSRLRITVTDDEQLEIEGECIYRGEEAALLRVIAEYLPEYMETRLEEVLGGSHPGSIISNVGYALGETLEEEARVTYSLRAPAHLAKAGALKVLELPWTMWFVPSELVPTESRRTPLEVVDWRGTYVEELTLELPPSLKPMALAPPLRLDETFGSFLLTREEPAANQLVCRKELRLSQLQIPQDQYAPFREFLLAALEAEREQIVLSSASR